MDGTARSPSTASYAYLNSAETRRDPASFWTAEAYERLRHVKALVDPDDRIRPNHPVPAT